MEDQLLDARLSPVAPLPPPCQGTPCGQRTPESKPSAAAVLKGIVTTVMIKAGAWEKACGGDGSPFKAQTVVMVSQTYAYLHMHQLVHTRFVQLSYANHTSKVKEKLAVALVSMYVTAPPPESSFLTSVLQPRNPHF